MLDQAGLSRCCGQVFCSGGCNCGLVDGHQGAVGVGHQFHVEVQLPRVVWPERHRGLVVVVSAVGRVQSNVVFAALSFLCKENFVIFLSK